MQLLQPISSRIRSPERPETQEPSPVCDLPGLGIPSGSVPNSATTFQSVDQMGAMPLNGSYGFSSGGSLEYAHRLVPAIYIEGEGYVPTSHPSIEPYLDSEQDRPETNPNIVMVPEHRLAGAYGNYSFLPESTRIVEASGPTLLSLPKPENMEPIIVSSKTGWTKETDKFMIYFLEGDCCVRQGKNSVQAPHAVIWVGKEKIESDTMYEITVYAEGDSSGKSLRLEFDPDSVAATIQDKKWFGRFSARTAAQVLIMEPSLPKNQEPAIYHRALEMMSPDYSVIRQVQHLSESTVDVKQSATTPRYRQITFSPRGDKNFNINYQTYPNNQNRGIIVISKGLNLIIEGVTDQEMLLGDVVDIAADHAVVWCDSPANLVRGEKQESNLDFEVYLEGNIIFRDQQRTIEAQRMYYDAKNNVAYILGANLTTPIIGVKGLSGSMRMRAEILQQLGEGLFMAKDSYVTTSMLGEPTYSLRSKKMTFQEKPGTSSCWGRDDADSRQILVAENNYLAARKLPVFYWPWMAADLKDPTFYIKNIAYGNSTTFGNQIKTRWNPFQLLNIRSRPSWLDGDIGLGWLEKRGVTHSADFSYRPSSFCSIPGPVSGKISFWGLSDKGGTDRLGGGRAVVPYPNKYRYRVAWKHRQELDSFCRLKGPWTFSAQIGKVSDRNLLNHYFNRHWNNSDNDTTSLFLKKYCDESPLGSSVSIFSEYALDKFYTNSNWLPRFDHYALGKSLLNDNLTWYGHTRVGYVDYNTASSPYATDLPSWYQDAAYFRYLPWELQPNSPAARPARPGTTDADPLTVNSSFEVFSTRQELDLPLNAGPFRFVPYVLGDFSHWGKDRSGKDVQRFYGQAGARLNLPFWKVFPGCSNRTWYVNGLAHKVDLDAEFSYARANERMDNLILTDSLDTWSLEDFRRRSAVTTFGAAANKSIPLLFDPRYYALRSGLAGNVTAGNMEIADDMTLTRVGMTHRFQTKRGPVGRRRIIDWITLGVHFTYFPEKEYNTFVDDKEKYSSSKSIGMIDYDFLWHVGDRFSVFSSGFFDGDQNLTTLGGVWQRPKRGNFSLSVDDFRGIIERTYLTMSVAYNMNEKYSFNYTTSYEIRSKWVNVGHNFMFVRTGESFRLLVGAVYNESREEWSFSFGLEPVFMRGIASKLKQMSTQAQTMSR